MATIKRNPGAIERVQPRKPAPASVKPELQDELEEESAPDMQDADDADSETVAEDVADEQNGEEPTADADDGAAEDADDLEADDADDSDALERAAALYDDSQKKAPSTAKQAKAATQQPAKAKTPASAAGAPPVQAGFAKRIGATSTKPVKPASMGRPYLESPRDFGIHIEGHLVRFKKGRTPIRADNPIFKAHALTVEQVLGALKADAYVTDNGAELHE